MPIRRAVVALAAVMLSACDGGRPSGSPPPADALATYTLSGSISEMTPSGLVPVDGARIEETRTHLHTETDGGGFYNLYGLYARTNTFWTSKPGYVTDKRDVAIVGDTRLSIRLRRIATSDSSSFLAFALPSVEAKQP